MFQKIFVATLTFLFSMTTAFASLIDFTDVNSPFYFAVSEWRADGNGWTQQPVLSFDGKDYRFDTPHEYVIALNEIEQFAHSVGWYAADVAIAEIQSEFKKVYPAFEPKVDEDSVDTPPNKPTPEIETASFDDIDLYSQTAVAANAAFKKSVGGLDLYFGSVTKIGEARNPVVVGFQNGEVVWLNENFETGGEDSFPLAAFFDGGQLFVAFSTDGADQNLNTSWRRFAIGGWLDRYGHADRTLISVVAKINPTNGEVEAATYLSSVTPSGNTTALRAYEVELTTNGVAVLAKAAYAPRATNKNSLSANSKNAPFDYRIELSRDLTKALSAEILE